MTLPRSLNSVLAKMNRGNRNRLANVEGAPPRDRTANSDCEGGNISLLRDEPLIAYPTPSGQP